MLTFAFPPGIRVDGRRAGVVTACLRKAVMSRIPDPLPPEISGHDAQESPHVAYLPLLDAGYPEATGDLLGVAVLCPPGRDDLSALVSRSLRRGKPFHLEFLRARLPLRAGPHRAAPLSPETWAGPSRSWSTVTPVVLNRFSGKGKEPEEIARTCVHMGLPNPARVAVDRDPLVQGGARIGRDDLARREKTPRPFTHASLEFPEPVHGPLCLGAQRYLGMGLFLPLDDQRLVR